jgi:general secretion pathway protein G
MTGRWGRRRSAQGGFTLIEVLVVLTILGLLLTVVAPRVTGWLDSGQERVARIQIRNLASAVEMFRLEVGRYPTQEEGLAALLVAPPGIVGWRGPYLEARELPRDPWGQPYGYRLSTGSGTAYDIVSPGLERRGGAAR